MAGEKVKGRLPKKGKAPPCRVEGCGDESHALRLCRRHYQWARNHQAEPPAERKRSGGQ